MGKVKVKEEIQEDENDEDVKSDEKGLDYNEKLNFVSVISDPMANRKLAKKLYKLIKKASKQKGQVLNGLKAVQRGIRRGQRGLVVFAGDVTPVDMMIHMPAVCEGKSLPFVFTPSRMDLAASMGHKRPCLMVLVKEGDDYQDQYEACTEEVKALPTKV